MFEIIKRIETVSKGNEQSYLLSEFIDATFFDLKIYKYNFKLSSSLREYAL
jgi:hypothetical protein